MKGDNQMRPWAFLSGMFWIGCVSLVNVGCTHQVVLETQDHSQPVAGQQERQTPVVSLLRVEDAVAAPEQQKDPRFLGQDVAHWGLLGFIPLRYDTNVYHSDRSRAEVVQEGMTAGLKKMGLPAAARPEIGMDQARTLPEGHLVLQTRLRSFEVTNTNSLIIILIANAGHLRKLNAHVVMECQLFQPGNGTALWQGTVEGTAEWDAGEWGDASINEKWQQERGVVVRQAIEDAVGNLVTKSGIRQISARLLSETHAKLLRSIQERETAGDLSAALQLSAQAYRTAGTPEQVTAALNTTARVVRKLPAKPVLPEEARKFGVQAGSLTEQKRYDEAISLYEKGLDIAPWWAEAHYNRALLLAHQNRYGEAMIGMKQFLVLAPNSPDAREAQDKIYEWELKK